MKKQYIYTLIPLLIGIGIFLVYVFFADRKSDSRTILSKSCQPISGVYTNNRFNFRFSYPDNFVVCGDEINVLIWKNSADAFRQPPFLTITINLPKQPMNAPDQITLNQASTTVGGIPAVVKTIRTCPRDPACATYTSVEFAKDGNTFLIDEQEYSEHMLDGFSFL